MISHLPVLTLIINGVNRKLFAGLDWAVQNKLVLNQSKTTSILFTNRLNGIESGKCQWPFCVLDHKLNFSVHTNSICSKLAKTAGLLHKVLCRRAF